MKKETPARIEREITKSSRLLIRLKDPLPAGTEIDALLPDKQEFEAVLAKSLPAKSC